MLQRNTREPSSCFKKNHQFDIRDFDKLQITERKLSYAKIMYLSGNPYKGVLEFECFR